MNLKQLLQEEDAVSPVIGVILMVAITVILAAVIGTFVLGLGDQVQQTAPQATFSFDYMKTNPSGAGNADDSLTITHDGGDKIEALNLNIAASGIVDDSDATTPSTYYIRPDNTTYAALADVSADGSLDDAGDVGEVTAGTSADLNKNFISSTSGSYTAVTHADFSGATIRVVWESSNGDNTATLGKWSGPDA